MNRLVVYRNCFTGDVSGGDMHMSGLLGWVLDNQPDVEPVLVLPRRDGQEKVYREVGRIKTITHPDTKVRNSIALMYLARAFRAVARVNRFLERGDVLVASSHFLPDVLPVFAAQSRARNKVAFIHHIIQDMERPSGLNTTLANLQEKLCFALIRSRFGKVVVVNQAVADRLRQLGFRKQQILLSSNFVQPLAQPKPYADKLITIAFCGRMVSQKGVDDFMFVCTRLSREVPGFRAVMIGVGPELERLRQEVKQRRLPVEIVGYADDQTKFDLMASAKLFLFPSVEEGWGIAIAESLAVGTPVLTYNLPVYQSIFGQHIHTATLKHRSQLLDKTRELLAGYDAHPETYHSEQHQITAFAEQFRLDRVAAKEYSFIGEE